jgi:predicted SprT family Zn-dependent metalloprotease
MKTVSTENLPTPRELREVEILDAALVDYAREICVKYNVPQVRLFYRERKHTYGQCFLKTNEITLHPFLKGRTELTNVFKHELAHHIAYRLKGDRGHGYWHVYYCIELQMPHEYIPKQNQDKNLNSSFETTQNNKK